MNSFWKSREALKVAGMICRGDKKSTSNRKYPAAMIRVFPIIIGKINGLLTKHGVKMAGYWPSLFFIRLYMDQRADVYKHTARKSKANIQPS